MRPEIWKIYKKCLIRPFCFGRKFWRLVASVGTTEQAFRGHRRDKKSQTYTAILFHGKGATGDFHDCGFFQLLPRQLSRALGSDP